MISPGYSRGGGSDVGSGSVTSEVWARRAAGKERVIV
jgi:hypothetical protein